MGFNLGFPALDVDLFVPNLIASVLGTRTWMGRERARIAGGRTSPARAAARERGERRGASEGGRGVSEAALIARQTELRGLVVDSLTVTDPDTPRLLPASRVRVPGELHAIPAAVKRITPPERLDMPNQGAADNVHTARTHNRRDPTRRGPAPRRRTGPFLPLQTDGYLDLQAKNHQDQQQGKEMVVHRLSSRC